MTWAWARLGAAYHVENCNLGLLAPRLQLQDCPHSHKDPSMPSLSVSSPQVLAALREMPPTRILSLRQQTQFLWDAYFSSIEKVIYTTLEVGLHLWGA